MFVFNRFTAKTHICHWARNQRYLPRSVKNICTYENFNPQSAVVNSIKIKILTADN